LRIAVDANLDSQKKSGETQLRKIGPRIDALRSQQRGIAEKCAARVISDEVAKELLSRECYSGGGGGIRTLDTPGMSRML
jgi:hypothetical protein